MMNICFVHNVSVVGGAERVSQSIMQNLPISDYRLSLVCTAKGELSKECEQLSVPTETNPMFQPSLRNPVKTLTNFIGWKNLIKKNQIDIFHTGDLISTRSLLRAALFTKTKIVCHIHFPFEEDFAKWVFSANSQPSGFLFCSQDLQNNLGAMLKKLCPKASQWVVHNAVDTDVFLPQKVSNKTIKIGIIANLQFRKGHDDFLDMAKNLKISGYSPVYEIIGGDILQEPREPLLKERVKELELDQEVTFHGQVNNVKELLQSLDIVVCASHEEAFPISILEAMACGKPIVSTNVNGIPEAIIDGESGLLVSPSSPEELSNKVKFLMDNPQNMKEIGDNARKRVHHHFGKNVFIQKIIGVYKSL
jgi:glycosyltransferase involved in cell wall biosynthesis